MRVGEEALLWMRSVARTTVFQAGITERARHFFFERAAIAFRASSAGPAG